MGFRLCHPGVEKVCDVRLLGCVLGALILIPAVSGAQTRGVAHTPSVPDLSGYWEYRTTTPLQRPEAFAGKPVLTPEEESAYLERRHASIGRERDLQLNADWWEPGGLTNGRTSLIVDPPDGRIPTLTEAARDRVRRLAVGFRQRIADGPEDRERYERCIMGRTIPLMAAAPTRLAQIFQTPDHVAILHEQKSELRIIPLDGSPAPAESNRQWQGHSRGRWDGDTLVVEVTGFNGQWTLQGAGPDARFVERFSVTDGDTLRYEVTVDDPASFAGRWTVQFPLTRAVGPLYENACHEGNRSMPLILSGARAEDAAAAR